MDRLASLGNPAAVTFPSAAIDGDNLEFSFSGLKTAVINHINTANQKGEEIAREDIAASFTKTVCDSVIKKLEVAYRRYNFNKFVLAGGVAANSHLREAISDFLKKKNAEFLPPPAKLCGDNGAMIAAQGYYVYSAGITAGYDLNARATGK